MTTKTKQWRGVIPDDLHTKLKVLAAQRRMTLSQVVIELLRKGVNIDAVNVDLIDACDRALHGLLYTVPDGYLEQTAQILKVALKKARGKS
jgi:hypothetical protein